MSLKRDIKELLLIKVPKTSCIETSVSLATVSEAVVTTTVASSTPNSNPETTKRLDHNNKGLILFICMKYIRTS